jgi:hypothetical protein
MKGDPLSSAHIVRDPAAAAVFTSSRQRRMLMLFATRPRTISEAAAASGIELKSLHHHATKLCRLGLLEVVGERSRAGRPLKLYRTTGDSFFIPEHAAPKPFFAELAAELRECLATANCREGRGMLFTLGADGQPLARLMVDDEASREGIEMWRILRLTGEELVSLRDELRAVVDRYEQKTAGRGAAYLVHQAIALRRRHSGSVDNERA